MRPNPKGNKPRTKNRPEHKNVPIGFVTGVDPGGSKRPGNAIVTAGRDRAGVKWITDARFGAWTSPDTMLEIAKVDGIFRPDVIEFESVSMQRAILEWTRFTRGGQTGAAALLGLLLSILTPHALQAAVTWRDDAGTAWQAPAKLPARWVVLGPHLVEMIKLLGRADRIVGVLMPGGILQPLAIEQVQALEHRRANLMAGREGLLTDLGVLVEGL